VDAAIATPSPIVGTAAARRAVGQPHSSWYRHHRTWPAPRLRSRSRHAPALAQAERQQVLDTLHAERFWDAAPASVYDIAISSPMERGVAESYDRLDELLLSCSDQIEVERKSRGKGDAS
jgi:hypothetical protein